MSVEESKNIGEVAPPPYPGTEPPTESYPHQQYSDPPAGQILNVVTVPTEIANTTTGPQFTCGKCLQPFRCTFQATKQFDRAVRCPHCSAFNAIGYSPNKRAMIYLAIGIILLVIGIGIIVLTLEIGGGYFVVMTGIFAVAIVLIGRAVSFLLCYKQAKPFAG